MHILHILEYELALLAKSNEQQAPFIHLLLHPQVEQYLLYENNTCEKSPSCIWMVYHGGIFQRKPKNEVKVYPKIAVAVALVLSMVAKVIILRTFFIRWRIMRFPVSCLLLCWLDNKEKQK